MRKLFLLSTLLLIVQLTLPSSSHAQFIVTGQGCGASGLTGIANDGTPVVCRGNPLVWTAVGGGGGIASVPALPATCTPGTTGNQSLNVAPFGEWYCDAPNHWSPIGVSGVSAGAFPSSLIAWYRCMPNDMIATLTDYSGKGNTVTGTVGTAPTIITGTGGCNFTGNGAMLTPTALNGALTLQALVSFQESAAGASVFNAPILGNGNGTANNAAGMLMQVDCGFNILGVEKPWCGPQAFDSVNQKSVDPQAIINGTAVLTVVFGANDHSYVNKTEVCSNPAGYSIVCAGAPSSAGINLFPYQLGGAAAGSGTVALSYYSGIIYEFAFYSAALSAAQVSQTSQLLINDAVNRGVTVGLAPTDVGNHFLADGDSQTGGGGSLAAYWPTIIQFSTGTPWTVVNLSFGGTNLKWVNNIVSNWLIPEFRSNTARNLHVSWLGTNDCVNSWPTAPPMDQLWRNYGQQQNQSFPGISTLLPIGAFDWIPVSMISRTQANCNSGTCDPCKNAINPVLRTNWRTYGAKSYIDMGKTALGADGSCVSGGASGKLCVDTVHPTQDAEYNIVSLAIQREVNGIYGNLDLNSATTYAAAAPAAVTITAASETGNTMTFTSASGAPPVGTCALVTGVTPVGYNTDTGAATDACWNVLTSNGTTSWTAYNGTTGLAAGSVFGTFSFPQQKDVDVAVILNFGAGNFTLEPCWMFGGQNVTIKNINAASSTIVPWQTETIDGAATLTITTQQTVILQSVLVSQAAAGCNWKRLQ